MYIHFHLIKIHQSAHQPWTSALYRIWISFPPLNHFSVCVELILDPQMFLGNKIWADWNFLSEHKLQACAYLSSSLFSSVVKLYVSVISFPNLRSKMGKSWDKFTLVNYISWGIPVGRTRNKSSCHGWLRKGWIKFEIIGIFVVTKIHGTRWGDLRRMITSVVQKEINKITHNSNQSFSE